MQSIQADQTFLRPASVLSEQFDTEADARRWMAAQLRQADREGIDTSTDWTRREIHKLP